MISKIIPIITPNVDWAVLARNAKQALGYNPLQKADAMDRELSDGAKLLAVLSAFRDRSADPLESIRNAGSLLKHLQYGFLVAADRESILEISAASELTLTINQSVIDALAVVVTGNLKEWRVASIEHCVPSAPYSVREFFDQVILYFQKAGLAEVWSDYRRINHKQDQTFYLEHKVASR